MSTEITTSDFYQNYFETSPTNKIIGGLYLFCVTAGFLTQTYNDGKMALIQSRQRRSTKNYEADWIEVKLACQRNIFINLWNSLVFPYLFSTNLIPKIVLYFNPDNRS